MAFAGKTAFITGATRGIGKSIALRLAREGANIIIAAKSVEENPKLGGTIYSAAAEVEAAGGKAFPVALDIRNEEAVQDAVRLGAEHFGGIDILVNNASAIALLTTDVLTPKKFDLMYDINVRGTYMVTQACYPHLKKASNPHILTLSPPISLDPKWLGPHVAYTVAKYSMSMFTLGWAAEFKKDRIGVNALWPRTTIDTAAVRNLLGGEALANMSRKPEIIADAAAIIFSLSSVECTGNCFIDEEVLAKAGITDLEKYAVTPGGNLYNDLFV